MWGIFREIFFPPPGNTIARRPFDFWQLTMNLMACSNWVPYGPSPGRCPCATNAITHKLVTPGCPWFWVGKEPLRCCFEAKNSKARSTLLSTRCHCMGESMSIFVVCALRVLAKPQAIKRVVSWKTKSFAKRCMAIPVLLWGLFY